MLVKLSPAAYFSSRELTNPPEIEIDGNSIKTKPNIKVLGHSGMSVV